MKVLMISDIHGDTENIEKLADVFAHSDIVLFAGDFAKFEHIETARPALESLVKRHESIFAVLGNCDEEDFLTEIDDADICVEKSMVFHDGLVIAGSGGGSKFTGTTPFERTEDELVGDFEIIENSIAQIADENGKCRNLVAIMHNPPKDTECDKISNGMHVGSLKLREFIEKRQPVLVVTGHIHESAGIDKVGDSVIVNPGSLAEGKYAVCSLINQDGLWRVEDLQLKSL